MATGRVPLVHRLEADLEAGDYVALWFIPDPASGMARAEMGMVYAFAVE
jgi:hypothetical protein